MSIYAKKTVKEAVFGNTYVGRGIILGKSEDGENAVSAYFIMGRSENSRNRIFKEEGEAVTIYPYDASKVEDPSLINLIVTNGDQTDTVYDFIKDGKSFEAALDTREFEPDAPNFTPRISGMITFGENDFTYKMSILKSIDEEGSACTRHTFTYPSKAGLGHFIHTYNHDGNPIPTFTGEPERVVIPNDIKAFADEIWNNLDENNKISLYVRYVNLKNGETKNVLINKYC